MQAGCNPAIIFKTSFFKLADINCYVVLMKKVFIQICLQWVRWSIVTCLPRTHGFLCLPILVMLLMKATVLNITTLILALEQVLPSKQKPAYLISLMLLVNAMI